MSDFYVSVHQHFDTLLVTKYVNGKRQLQKINDFKPFVFVPVAKSTEWSTVDGRNVAKVDFDSIKEARNFIKQQDPSKIYGMTNWSYLYTSQSYPGTIEYNPDVVNIGYLDIETCTKSGYPDVSEAQNEITAITLVKKEAVLVLCCMKNVDGKQLQQHYPNHKIHLVKCDNEEHLLKTFVTLWSTPEWSVEVISGWNVEFFDIPYIVRRVTRVLGDKWTNQLSPWGLIKTKPVEMFNKPIEIFELVGIAVLDYLALYKKFSNTPQESYKLDFIAQEELGEQKLDYSEYGTLDQLLTNNPQKYMQYNVHDTILVQRLDDKFKFIELVMAIAYYAKVNYADTLGTIRCWDVIIHNYLLAKNKVVPPMKPRTKEVASFREKIPGAYVKDPIVGLQNWIVSFDVVSLYPSLIRQYNISPEMYVKKVNLSVDQIINDDFEDIKKYVADNNYTLCGSGCMFLREVEGFLPTLMGELFDKRTQYKILAKGSTTDYEREKYDKMQHAIKIVLNSGYGALANPYFRWFQPDLAKSITLSGQLTIRYLEKNLTEFLSSYVGVDTDYVIAADTDSQYLTLDLVLEKLNGGNKKVRPTDPSDIKKAVSVVDKFAKSVLAPRIDRTFETLATMTNARQRFVKMNREVIANKGVWSSKKHYALNVWDKEGTLYDKPKLKIMGFAAIKSSTPALCKIAIKRAIEIILNDDISTFQKHCAQFKDIFKTSPLDKIGKPTSVDGIDKYGCNKTIFLEKTPQHVRAALTFNHWVLSNKMSSSIPLIENGDKITFVHLYEPNPFRTDVLANPTALLIEIPDLIKYVNLDKQYDATFIKPLSEISSAIKWDIVYKPTLDDLFA